MPASKVTKHTLYAWEGHKLEFVRSRRTPGFSHRVVLDGVAVDWLADTHRPTGTVALYYFQKHLTQKA